MATSSWNTVVGFLEEGENAGPLLGVSSLNPGLLAFTLLSIRLVPADQTLTIFKESDTIGENVLFNILVLDIDYNLQIDTHNSL